PLPQLVRRRPRLSRTLARNPLHPPLKKVAQTFLSVQREGNRPPKTDEERAALPISDLVAGSNYKWKHHKQATKWPASNSCQPPGCGRALGLTRCNQLSSCCRECASVHGEPPTLQRPILL